MEHSTRRPLVAITLSAACLLSLVACGNSESGSSESAATVPATDAPDTVAPAIDGVVAPEIGRAHV